jgi:tRNA-splicing ligase RtcB
LRRKLDDVVDDLREGDGVDPRYEQRETGSNSARVSDLRLATQIAHALSMVLSESHEPTVSALRVDNVKRIGRGGTFSVRLVADNGVPDFDVDAARRGVAAIAGRLRAEVTGAIRRKYAPSLRFEIMRAGGWVVPEEAVEGPSGEALPPVPPDPGSEADSASEAFRDPIEPSSAPDPALHSRPLPRSRRTRGLDEIPIEVWSADKALPTGVEDDLRQIRASPDVRYMAVMPDIHRGKLVPNGLVLATRRLVYPQAVGADVGCGVLAARLGVPASALENRRLTNEILKDFMRSVPILKRTRRHPTVPLPSDLASRSLSSRNLNNEKLRDGLLQLGTLGRGNHFLELQVTATGEVWIMIHTGSRGLGQAVFAHHARNASKEDTKLLVLDAETDTGQAYVADIAWALGYASANRHAILRACDEALQARLGFGVEPSTVIDVPHNFLRSEEHFGERFWVHRKSALSAADGELTLVPGSMAGPSFHVLGRGSKRALASCAHGAGRSMSRSEARREVTPASLRRQMRGVTFDERAESALVEEAPEAYKDPRAVMRAQRDLVKTVRVLKPVVNFKSP